MVHFNANLDREDCTINGATQVKVHYPKFKNGEAVVRNVKVAENFGKEGFSCSNTTWYYSIYQLF